jgi:large subunit ribosomal protein L4
MKIKIININNQEKTEEEVKVTKNKAGLKEEHLMYLLTNHQNEKEKPKTANTLNRAQVRGGGAKPYRQKGNGRARRGTNNTPLRRGGGVIFGPSARPFNMKLNNQQIRQTSKIALQDNAHKIIVIDYDPNVQLKTKQFNQLLCSNKDKQGKMVFVANADEESFILGCRNMRNSALFTANYLPIQAVINAQSVIFSKAAFAKIKELYLV